ncbi:MAG: molybdopterin-guanine dinucleotide biosynthesis protein B [Gammaproteobacteria bacterium]|nr:molybdopterin-guanine dinucleotide biosynthesis protein B [Gammaproteobacteria bacterium]
MNIPVLGFCAYSGTGKTTLLASLLPLLRDQGLRVGVVKHAHHNFEVDQPGKDSYVLRKAGAREMLVVSGGRWALMVDTEAEGDPVLQEVLNRFDCSRLDLILVEGFRHESFPKIELHRPSLGKPLIHPSDSWVIAVATDEPQSFDTHLPLLDINRPEVIVAFIVERFIAGEVAPGSRR